MTHTFLLKKKLARETPYYPQNEFFRPNFCSDFWPPHGPTVAPRPPKMRRDRPPPTFQTHLLLPFGILLTNAKKVTVSVLYWYEKLSSLWLKFLNWFRKKSKIFFCLFFWGPGPGPPTPTPPDPPPPPMAGGLGIPPGTSILSWKHHIPSDLWS